LSCEINCVGKGTGNREQGTGKRERVVLSFFQQSNRIPIYITLLRFSTYKIKAKFMLRKTFFPLLALSVIGSSFSPFPFQAKAVNCPKVAVSEIGTNKLVSTDKTPSSKIATSPAMQCTPPSTCSCQGKWFNDCIDAWEPCPCR
jgi:hypothetical protein